MADKKISELLNINEAGGIDYDNDYTIARRGTKNFQVKIGDIINESKSLIPKNITDLKGYEDYVTNEELEAKEYLTQNEAKNTYASITAIPTKLSQFSDDLGVATEKQLSEKVNELKHYTEVSVDKLETFVDEYINETNVTINDINITINETKDDMNTVMESDFLKKKDLPTVVSYFTNDSGYITLVDLGQQEATDAEVNTILSNILK